MRFKPRYKQLIIDGFRSSLDGLDKKNRWVWLGEHLPWGEYENLYSQTLNNQTVEASAKPAHMVIETMLVKHITRLSDQDTIEMIQENPHMLYLCDLKQFTDQPIFDASLFVDLHKRISDDDINKMTEALMKREQKMKDEIRKREEDKARDRGEEPPAAPSVDENAAAFVDSQGRTYLQTGDIFPQVIQEYINSVDLSVLFWSENALKSEYVQKERTQALERAFPQVRPRQEAKLSIYPMSIEPRAELPSDMKDNYHFGEL